MKRRTKILSALLSFVLILTSLFPITIVANAGSSGGHSVGTGGPNDPDWGINEGEGVLKITISGISDKTTEDSMKSIYYRYGTGKTEDGFYAIYYPLYMQQALHDIPGKRSDKYLHIDNYNADNCFYDMNAEFNNWQKARRKIIGSVYHNDRVKSSDGTGWNQEYIPIPYTDGKGKKHSGTCYEFSSNEDQSTNGYNGKNYNGSIFLEDAIGRVLKLKDSGKLKDDDVKSFWLFYCWVASGANEMRTPLWDYGNDTLGETLRVGFNDILKDSTNSKMFRRGYIVALYSVYGDECIKKLFGATKTLEDIGDNWEPFRSILATRLQGVGNKGYDHFHNLFLSTSGIISLIKDTSSTSSSVPFQDYIGPYSRFGNSSYNNYLWIFRCHISTTIYPRRTKLSSEVKEVKSGIFSGWGYYDFTDGTGDAPIDPTQFVDDNKYILGSTRTVNAYLVNKNDYNTDNIDKMRISTKEFGDNGHVMSDTTFISEPFMIPEGEVKQWNSAEVKDDMEVQVSVDKNIYLDSPFISTKYKLARLVYTYTNANGRNSTVIQSSHSTWAAHTYKYIDQITVKDGNVVKIKKGDLYNIYHKQLGGGEHETVAFHYRDVSNKITDVGINQGYYTIDNKKYPYYVYKWVTDSPNDQWESLNITTNKEDVKDYMTKNGLESLGTFPDIENSNLDKNSVYYIKMPESDDYVPAVFYKDYWYITPVVSSSNILVNIRADYVATYDPNDSVFKAQDFKSYLLAQNFDTKDFSNKTLYSIIDDYTTGEDGTLENRSNAYQSGDGMVTNGEGYTYPAETISRFNRNLIHDSMSIGALDALSGVRRKVAYISVLDKTVPPYLRVGNDFPNNYKYCVDKLLPVEATTYDKNGNSIALQERITQYELWDTNSTANKKNQNFSSVGAITNNAPGGIMYSVMSNNVNERSTPLGEIQPTIDHSELGLFAQSNGGINTSHNYEDEKVNFGKVLAAYTTNVYALKSRVSKSSVPYYASWIPSASSNGLKVGLESADSRNIVSLNGVGNIYLNFIRFGHTTNVLEQAFGAFTFNVYDLRRITNMDGKPPALDEVIVNSFNPNINVTSRYHFMQSFTQSSYDVPLKYNVNVFNPNKTNLRFINTSMSVIDNKKINSTYQYNNVTTPSGSGLYKTSGNSVSLGIYPEVLMWAENDITRGKQLSYYEVNTAGTKKRYIPAMTYTQLDFNNMSMTAKVTGTAIAYDTRAKALATRLGSTIPPVLYSGSGLKMAFEAKSGGKAKVYALDISDKYSTYKTTWGNSQYSASNAAAKAVNNILSNIKGSMDKKLSIYNGSSLKEISMGSDNSVKLSASTPEYTNRYYDLKIHAGKIVSVDCKEIGSDNIIRTINTYVLTYPSNNSTDVSILCKPNVGSQESRDKATKLGELLKGLKLLGSDSILPACFENNTGDTLFEGNENSTEREVAFDKWIKAHNSSYENRYSIGGHSYFEDTSVLTIKEFNVKVNISGNTTATEQLPLTLGPKTPINKNEYFTNGYKGFVVGTLTLKGKTGTPLSTFSKSVVSKHTKMNTAESIQITNSTAKDAIPDFIIADVTINEATAY